MNIQQLRAQIATLQDATMDENKNFRTTYDEGKFDALSAVDALLNSLQEEPVSEDLEEAAEEWDESLYRSDAFKAGAKWKEKQMMKNAISTTVCYTMNAPSALVSLPSGFEYGDKIKVIIIKSE